MNQKFQRKLEILMELKSIENKLALLLLQGLSGGISIKSSGGSKEDIERFMNETLEKVEDLKKKTMELQSEWKIMEGETTQGVKIPESILKSPFILN